MGMRLRIEAHAMAMQLLHEETKSKSPTSAREAGRFAGETTLRSLQRDLLHAPVAAREEEVIPLTRHRVRPVAARARELRVDRRRVRLELVDVETDLAPARGDDRAVTFDADEPAPAVFRGR